MVVNASDIQICLPFDGESADYEPVAHVFNATLSVSSSLKPIIKLDDADSIWDNDIVDGFSYSLSGSSYLVIAPGHSFDDLLNFQVNQVPVPVIFKILNVEYTGSVIIRSLRITGNTEQNAQLSFDMKGQGKFEKNES